MRVPWTSGRSNQSVLIIHWKDWCWSWNSNTLATWCEELAYLKRPWCWERLKVGRKGDDRGWDSWMASPTQWTWVWVNSWSWWWTGRPGILQSMGSQRVEHNWVAELNWTEVILLRQTSNSTFHSWLPWEFTKLFTYAILSFFSSHKTHKIGMMILVYRWEN